MGTDKNALHKVMAREKKGTKVMENKAEHFFIIYLFIF